MLENCLTPPTLSETRFFTNCPAQGLRPWYIRQMRDNEHTGLDLAIGTKTPGFTAIDIFLCFWRRYGESRRNYFALARHGS